MAKTKEEKQLYMQQWRKLNADKIKTYAKKWKTLNVDHIKSYQKEYHNEYRKRDDVQQWFFEKNLRLNYGITENDFLELWENQDGKCMICDTNLIPRGRKHNCVAIDHNHLTDEIRGLLCRGCNSGIGHFKDNPEVLIAAANYLKEMGNYSNYKKRIINVK